MHLVEVSASVGRSLLLFLDVVRVRWGRDRLALELRVEEVKGPVCKL
jgi:hypothetical protein